MIYKNEKIHWLTAIMTLAARDPKVRMILFAGYIDDGMTYELYSDGLPYDITNAIYDAVKENDEWHEAVKKAGILEIDNRYYVSETVLRAFLNPDTALKITTTY